MTPPLPQVPRRFRNKAASLWLGVERRDLALPALHGVQARRGALCGSRGWCIQVRVRGSQEGQGKDNRPEGLRFVRLQVRLVMSVKVVLNRESSKCIGGHVLTCAELAVI